MEQSLSHNPNEIRTLHPELGLRDVPGKFRQWGRQTQRLGPILGVAPIHPARDEVIRVSGPPRRLLLPSARFLAFRLGADVLPRSDSRIWTEPPAADRAGSFPRVWHGDPMIAAPYKKVS